MMQLNFHEVQSIELTPIKRLGEEGREFNTRDLLITDANGNTVRIGLFASASDELRVTL